MKKLSVPIFIGGMVLFVGAWAYIQAEGEEILVCVNKVGIPRLVSSTNDCRRGERLVSWNKEGIKGDSGIDGKDGADGANLHLFDANGQDLGIYIGFEAGGDATHKTYVPALHAFLEFYVRNLTSGATVTVEPRGGVFYMQSNCEGVVYITDEKIPNMLLRDENKFFVVTSDAPTSQTLKSEWHDSGCVNTNIFLNGLYRVEEVTLPFSYPPAFPLEVRAL